MLGHAISTCKVVEQIKVKQANKEIPAGQGNRVQEKGLSGQESQGIGTSAQGTGKSNVGQSRQVLDLNV